MINPYLTNLKQVASIMKNVNNPQMMLNDLASKNPQLKSALDMSNGDYQQAFNTLAEQMNINPEEIISLFR